MAEANTKKNKEKKKLSGKKKLGISAVAISDNIVYSKTEQWAYFRLSNSVFDFLSTQGKIAGGQQIVNAFVNLMSNRQESLDCHTIITSTPVDVEGWEDQIRVIAEDWNKAQGFDQYLNEQVDYLLSQQYLKKITYLGICIGKRGALELDTSNFFEMGLKGAGEQIKTWLSTALKTPSVEVSASEEKEARRREEDFYRTLSVGHLRAERCTAEEILLLFKRQFYPGMSAPYLDVDHDNRIGPGDFDLELTSAIHNKLRHLKINQMIDGWEFEGYRATLTISKLPKEVEFPYSTFPFMYFLYKLGLSFTSYSRFTLHPTSAMRKELDKKKKEQKDELENMSGANTLDSNLGLLPAEVQEAMEDMALMNEMLSADKVPWVEGTYRVVIETANEKTLKEFASIVKQRYTDLDIQINWTVGDQAELFLEQMPGDKLRSGAHKQLTNLVMFATSGFNYSSDVGDTVYDGDSLEAR
jgi:hypothetical protein